MRAPRLSAIDLNLLVALDALLDEVSVGRAGKRLGRSQPAMSRILGRLRVLLDDPLLVQEGRSMALTARARGLRDPLKRFLGDAAGLIHPPRPFEPAKETRRFHLQSSDYVHVVAMGAIIEALGAEAPRLSFSVAGPTSDPAESLAAGKADLFFGPPAFPDWCEGAALMADPWVCVRRAGCPLPATVPEYLALDHIDVAVEQRFGGPIARALGHRAAARRNRLLVQDFAGALFVVATSSVCATVPRPVALRAAEVMPIVSAEVPFRIPPSEVWMIWARRATPEPGHAWLRDAVRRAMRGPAPRRTGAGP